MTTTIIAQHNQEIHDNLQHWMRKPLLQKVYRSFYERIAGFLVPGESGTTVELGSGIGKIRSVLPECITTDIFPNPWIDQVENAYQLSFPDGTVSNLILFDVWHHLQYPGSALKEFHRVLRPGGRTLIFEPGMGLLGRLIYGYFHHEPVGYRDPIQWFTPSNFSASEISYYAAQGNATRIFCTNSYSDLLSDWEVVDRMQLSAISYVCTGGFRGPQIYPAALLSLIRSMENLLDHFPMLFATRLLVVLQKK